MDAPADLIERAARQLADLNERSREDGRIIAYYTWKDTIRRGPGLDVNLLWTLAHESKHDIPALADPIARMEWHIEHVLALARRRVNAERTARGLPPAIFVTRETPAATHVYQTEAGGALYGCETPLPSFADPDLPMPAVCTCGRYVIEQVAPHHFGA